ncbi:hypothetical protein [Phreatobacter sp. AB_2022a]|uniref:hypothetical protein n=1 Tax=Phreatobacter sp. AB_2022a TaxID=3003134 RepID=UPI0022870FE4|nr:hypothetical protein [Phreatobacter sp. AB_2022a]MCZ0738269.1 hypothetical protein [Phreatobacter sp. AB_2022a]
MSVSLRIAAAVLALAGTAGAAAAQSLDMSAGKPLGELINSGYAISSTTTNGRPGEIVMTLQQGTRAFICVVTGARGTNQSDPPARLTALPCIPVN